VSCNGRQHLGLSVKPAAMLERSRRCFSLPVAAKNGLPDVMLPLLQVDGTPCEPSLHIVVRLQNHTWNMIGAAATYNYPRCPRTVGA